MLRTLMGKKNKKNKSQSHSPAGQRPAGPTTTTLPEPPKKPPPPQAVPQPSPPASVPRAVALAPSPSPAPATATAPAPAAVVKEPTVPEQETPPPSSPEPTVEKPVPIEELAPDPEPIKPIKDSPEHSALEVISAAPAPTLSVHDSVSELTREDSTFLLPSSVAAPIPSHLSVPTPVKPSRPDPVPELEPPASVPVSPLSHNTMTGARVTFEHLDIIYKYGTDSVNKTTAVPDMHSELKGAQGGLGALTNSQYVNSFNPLKEAIWFERKGQFAIGCQQDWTLCKVFMSVKKNSSSLNSNLALVDLEELPGDDASVYCLKTLGNRLVDDATNEWFHNTLEALYDLVEMDSTGSSDSKRRDELLHKVHLFVKTGSRTCFQTAVPAPSPWSDSNLPLPQRLSFGMIEQAFAKVKEVGGDKDPSCIDWVSLKIPAEDAKVVWQSITNKARGDLPQTAWWKVLYLIVQEMQPQLLRLNLHLLDKVEIATYDDFCDECVEPPDQDKTKFYQVLIQVINRLHTLCLTSTPPRRDMTVLNALDHAFFTSYPQFVKHIVEATNGPTPSPAPAVAPPTPPAIPSLLIPEANTDAPNDAPLETAIAPVPDPAEPSDVEPTENAAQDEPLVADATPEPTFTSQAPAPEPVTSPAPLTTPELEPPVVPAEPTPGPVALAAPPHVTEKPPIDATPAATAKQRSSGLSLRSPPIDIPTEIKTGPIQGQTRQNCNSDNFSLTGSLAELNKEEMLVDLLQQAAAVCEQITLEKRQLITKERRQARNLRSAQDNLKALQTVNAQLMAENSDQKEEIYQREDEINQLHSEGQQAAKELSRVDGLNSQLQEKIEELTKTIESLTVDKIGLHKELEESREKVGNLRAELAFAGKEKQALEAQVASAKEAKAGVENEMATMRIEKDSISLELKGTKTMLESANDEIDRLEEIQAEQQRMEAETRRAAMEARRREFETAEKEALASLQKAEELRAATSIARRNRGL
jgi:hypothetical protein